MRSSMTTAVAVVVATLFVVGCAQTSSPTSPSSSASSPTSPSSPASSSVSGSTSSAQSTNTFLLLAQLNLVDDFLVIANKQLNLFVSPPSVTQPPSVSEKGAGGRSADEVAHSEFSIADSILGTVAQNYSPFARGTDALNAIIREADITLDLIGKLPPCPPPPPTIPQIKAQAQHIISVATTLIECQKSPCF